jgi:hypothetical protein
MSRAKLTGQSGWHQPLTESGRKITGKIRCWLKDHLAAHDTVQCTAMLASPAVCIPWAGLLSCALGQEHLQQPQICRPEAPTLGADLAAQVSKHSH